MMVDINTAKLSSHIVTISNLYMPNNQIIGGSPFMFKCDTQEKIKI
jgi:hypothetical protein